MALSIGLLFYLALSPLLMFRNRFFLFLWLFISPFLYKSSYLGQISVPTFIITGLSMPYALVLFYNHMSELLKKFDFLKFIIFLQILMLLNLFRPDSSPALVLMMVRYYFIAFFIVGITYFYMKTENKASFIYKCTVPIGIINALVAVFQKATGVGMMIIEGFPRVSGIFPHPNQCGFFINLFMPLSIYLLTQAKTRKQKIFFLFNFLLSLLVLVLTLSKTSYLIFLINIVLFMNIYGNIKTKFKIYLSIPIIASVILVLCSIFNYNIIGLIGERFSNTDSLSWRLRIWSFVIQGMDLWKFLFGAGLDTADRYIMSVNSIYESSNIHNGYLQLVYELGIFGLSFIAFIVAIFRRSLKFMLDKKYSDVKIYGLIPLMLANVFLIETFFDQSIQSRFSLYLFIVLSAVFYVKMNNAEESYASEVRKNAAMEEMPDCTDSNNRHICS